MNTHYRCNEITSSYYLESRVWLYVVLFSFISPFLFTTLQMFRVHRLYNCIRFHACKLTRKTPSSTHACGCIQLLVTAGSVVKVYPRLSVQVFNSCTKQVQETVVGVILIPSRYSSQTTQKRHRRRSSLKAERTC